MDTNRIVLGRTYRDCITGFQGVATGYVTYLTGCNQVVISPGLNKDGEYQDGHWFDETRLEHVVGVADKQLPPRTNNGAGDPPPNASFGKPTIRLPIN